MSKICYATLLGLLLTLSFLNANPPADSAYYSDRCRIIGFQDFESTRPNRLLATPADRRQAYRMGSVDIPVGFSKEQAQAEAQRMKAAGFNMVLAEKCRSLVYDLLPENQDRYRRPLKQLVADTKMLFDALHAEGVQTMHHVTCTMVPHALLERHPDWAAINLNTGQSDTNIYGTANTCINNDEFWQTWFGKLEFLLRNSPADAVMIDEIQFFAPHLCGCQSCRTKFNAETGFHIPENGQYKNWASQDLAGMRRWRLWRHEKVLERQVACRKLIKSINPDMVFSAYLCNNTTGYQYASSGMEISAFPLYADSLGLESMPHGLSYFDYYPLVIVEMKYLRAVAEHTGNAYWTLFYGRDNLNDMFTGLCAFLEGSRQWWWIIGKSQTGWKPLLQWEMQHEELLINNHPAGNIAVLYSAQNRDRNPFGGSAWELGCHGLCNALTDTQTPYHLVIDADCQDSKTLARKADTLVAFNAAVWSENALAALEQFVADGGVLICSGDFSRADENFEKKTNFAASNMLGFDYHGEISKGAAFVVPQPNPVTGELIGRFAYKQRIIKIKNIAPDLKILGSFEDLNGQLHPGLLVREFGRGKIVYFAGAPERCHFFHFYNINKIVPGKHWDDQRDPVWAALLARIVRAYNDRVVFEADNFPPGVLIEAHQQAFNDALGVQLQLVNFQSMRVRGGLQPQLRSFDFPSVRNNRPNPSAPMTLDILAPETKKVYLFSVDFRGLVDWPFQFVNGRVKVEIPDLYRHLTVYCSQGSDRPFVAASGGKVMREYPPPLPLRSESMPALAAPYDPSALTVFADSEEFSGGVRSATWYQQEPALIIYGDKSQKTTATATLQLEREMLNPRLALGALCDDVVNSRAPIIVTVNGVTVFEGAADFPDNRWSVREYPLPFERLAPGTHTVSIRNTGKGPLNNIPWLGISFVRLKSAGKTLDISFKNDALIPISGEKAELKGHFQNDAMFFGSAGSGSRFPARYLVGEKGGLAFSFSLLETEESGKVARQLVTLRPQSLLSVTFSVNRKSPVLNFIFYHPLEKKGVIIRTPQPLEYGKTYEAALTWDGQLVCAYLNGELVGEGCQPMPLGRINDLFIGPFTDQWVKVPAWTDDCIIYSLRTWNVTPSKEEIFLK